MNSDARALLIQDGDNVAVALEDIPEGAMVQVSGSSSGAFQVKALQPTPFAHKIAVRAVSKASPVIKYGAPVAAATADIEVGAWVHGHNAESIYARRPGKGKP